MKKILMSLSLATIALSSIGGGFKVGLQGQKQIGMGHIGTGLALDASSVYFNPASMSFVSNQISLGGTSLIPRVQFLDASTQIVTDAIAKTSTPFSLYGVYHVSKKLTVGLGVYTPFGSGIEYPTNWTGRLALTKVDLKAIFIKPTVSYKLTNDISIGAGFVYSTGSFSLERDIPLLSQGFTNDGHAKLVGSANGMGFDAGLYFQKNKLSAGLTYRHQLNMKVKEGDATFTNIPSSASTSFPNTTFTSTLPLPGEIALGIGYKVNSKLVVSLDYNYTLWNAFDSLGFDYLQNTTRLKDDKSPRLYENSSTYRAGAQYNVNNKFDVRAGIYYDMTPVKDGYVSPETPDNNRLGLTAGASYKITKALSVDASLLYQNVPGRTQTNVTTNLSGTFATRVMAPGIGISYKFNQPKPKSVKPEPNTNNSNQTK